MSGHGEGLQKNLPFACFFRARGGDVRRGRPTDATQPRLLATAVTGDTAPPTPSDGGEGVHFAVFNAYFVPALSGGYQASPIR